MDWQPESSGRSGWYEEAGGRGHDGLTSPGASGSGGPRRWVLHGGHGHPGMVASPQGPHLAPRPGPPGR